MKHAIKLSEAFQIVDNGPTKSLGKPKRRHGKDRKSESDDDKDSETEPIKRTKHDPKLPICLYPPHKAKGYWHYLKDCTACSEQEKKDLLKAHAEEKAKTGPSKSTRAQKLATAAAASATASSQSSSGTANQNVTGRLKPVNFEKKTSSFNVNLCDGSEQVSAVGRADDGSDESIVTSKLAETAAIQGIEKYLKSNQ